MKPNQSDRFPRPVVCAWCWNAHRSIVPADICGGVQGDGCASVVIHKNGSWYVCGAYGSTSYDMTRFKFVRNPPTEEADPVCDNCIGERHSAGDLVRICDCGRLCVSDETETSNPDLCSAAWESRACQQIPKRNFVFGPNGIIEPDIKWP
jgi:hypothetical protein